MGKMFLAAVLLVLAGIPSVFGGELVLFDDGRGLRVSRWEVRDGLARLDLVEGGTLFVPASRVVGSEPLPAAPEVEAVESLADELRRDERWREAAGEYADLVAEAAGRHGLEVALLAAVAKVESDNDPFAVSPKGACGIVQLMPETADRFGVRDIFDVRQNLDGGARYLRWLLDRYDGRTDLALAGYNAGEGAVDRYGGIPPYRETRSYVARVLGRAGQIASAP